MRLNFASARFFSYSSSISRPFTLSRYFSG
nr:MAG TPA: hypothetical protein [Caudoviricetes sp.]